MIRWLLHLLGWHHWRYEHNDLTCGVLLGEMLNERRCLICGKRQYWHGYSMGDWKDVEENT